VSFGKNSKVGAESVQLRELRDPPIKMPKDGACFGDCTGANLAVEHKFPPSSFSCETVLGIGDGKSSEIGVDGIEHYGQGSGDRGGRLIFETQRESKSLRFEIENGCTDLKRNIFRTPLPTIAHVLLTFYSKAPIFLQGVYRRGIWHPIKPICCKVHCT
jgi:hypothetical protein